MIKIWNIGQFVCIIEHGFSNIKCIIRHPIQITRSHEFTSFYDLATEKDNTMDLNPYL